MKKNNIIAFYMINILSSIIEAMIVGSLVYFVVEKINIALITGWVWIALGIISYIFLKLNQKPEIFKENKVQYDNPKFQNEFDLILEKANKYIDKNIEFVYSDIFMNPAGALNEKLIIINPEFIQKGTSKTIIKGLIGHEIGHIMSGLITHSPITFIHFGAIFQFLYYIPMLLCVKNEKKFKWLIVLLLILAIPFNLTNYLSIFYYYRKDEHYANYNAHLLDTAEELRSYYYGCGHQSFLLRLSDVKHPSPKSMLEKLDKWMNKNEFEKRIYLANGEIYKVDNNGLDISKVEMKFKYYRHHHFDNELIATEYADCFFNGEGTKRDIRKALGLYKKINTQDAKHMVGMCYILLGEETKGYEELLKNLDYPITRIEMAKKYYNENRYQEALKMIENLEIREAKMIMKKILIKLNENSDEGESDV